jgi:hypothetical protein
LRRVGKSYADYYNHVRTHRSLNKDAPVSRPVQRTGVISSRAIAEAKSQPHDDIWKESDRLVKINEKDPRISALMDEAVALERTIAATPAFTRKGLAGGSSDAPILSLLMTPGCVATILQVDAERIAADAERRHRDGAAEAPAADAERIAAS